VFVVFIWNQNVFSQTKNNPTPVPNERQLLWQEAELGVLYSYDLHVFDGKEYRQSRNRIYPVPDYQIFNPKHLDTDQWIRAAKAAGAKFAILTATHETILWSRAENMVLSPVFMSESAGIHFSESTIFRSLATGSFVKCARRIIEKCAREW
jgi:hypothetical protein